MESYINHIIQELIKLTGLTPQNATELFEYYRPTFEEINGRHLIPTAWAEIILSNFQSGMKVEKWVEFAEWYNIPVEECE